MKRFRWLIIVGVLVLLVSLVYAAERMSPDDVKGLAAGGFIVMKDGIGGPQPTLNPLPLGQDGYVIGFAFAPGRAELAYTAMEEQNGAGVSVLRIARVSRLWPVPREVPKVVKDRQGNEHRYMDMQMVNLPFAERERELLRLDLQVIENEICGMVLKGPIQWSPDGTKLALGAGDGALFTHDLWVVDYGTAKRSAVTNNEFVSTAVWSPNSAWIALVVGKPEARDTEAELRIYDVRSQKMQFIAKGVKPEIEWSADSKQLLFQVFKDTKVGRVYNLETEKITQSALPIQAQYPWYVSPDKRYVAVQSQSDQGSSFSIWERSTRTVRLKIPDAEFACWHPNSKVIAFQANGGLAITALDGAHKGKIVPVADEAGSFVRGLPFAGWSTVSIPADYPGQRSEVKPGEGISWLAFAAAEGQVRVLMLGHRTPTFSEKIALGMPIVSGSLEEKVLVSNNLKQIALGLLMYAEDYDETLPIKSYTVRTNNKTTTVRADQVIFPYVKTDTLFQRPGYKDAMVFRYLGSSTTLGALPSPAETPIGIIDYWRDGGYVAYADGHVTWADRKDIEAILQKARDVFGE